VVWYAGATASQIERSIAKAAGLGEAPIECRDGEDVAPWANISWSVAVHDGWSIYNSYIKWYVISISIYNS
jgi:hypothetical protein